MAKEKQSLMNRFIHIIEKGGNKLPHPFILFGILLVAVLILSFVFSQLEPVSPTSALPKQLAQPGRK